MPTKPPANKSLVFNVSMKISGETLDALEIIRRVTGAAAGTTVREAFEDQIAGLGAMHDRGYQAVRDYRNEKATTKILNLNAWCDAWIRHHPETSE